MQIYRYGEIVDLKAPLTAEDVSAVVQEGRQRARELQALSLSAIVDVLDRVGSAWSRPDYALRKLALAELPARIKFSAPMVEQGILTMADLLKRENLETRLACDLGDSAYLDGWVYHTRFGGHYLAQPLGVVAHVSAGNVFPSSSPAASRNTTARARWRAPWPSCSGPAGTRRWRVSSSRAATPWWSTGAPRP
jgi:hypothetical protein